jgi:transcription initiation factor TFIID subunit 2
MSLTGFRYFDIIKEPMDLSTIGAKLEAGMYKDRFAFQSDFHLMISNAKLYNAAGSYAHNEAIALETFFEKREYARFIYNGRH